MGTKDFYLDKRMTELGLGGAFGNWFLRFPMDNPRLQPKEPAITLREFFILNPHFLTDPQARFVCNKDGDGFALQSASYQKLESFLSMKGFTGQDWIMLHSHNKQGNLFPFSFDKKAEIVKQPFISMGFVKLHSATLDLFLKMVPGKKLEEVTLADVLAITNKSVEHVTGVVHNWKISYDEVQHFRSFIKKLQEKLTGMGFKREDSPFLDISFAKEKLPQGVNYYLRRKLKQRYGDNYLDYISVAKAV